jgi:hypothetical protein
MTNLLDHVNDYLIAQGLVRDPRVAGSAPPLWLMPRDGVPAPGESPKNNAVEVGPDIVVGAFTAPGISLGRHNGFRRIKAVDFWIRVRKAPMIDDFDAALHAAFNDKRGWDMAGLYVMESLVWREVGSPIESGPSGWTFTSQYTLELLNQ